MLPSGPVARSDQEYMQKYGGKKLMSELVKFGKITGKNWAEALLAFDSETQSIEKFHKEVVIPLLKARKKK